MARQAAPANVQIAFSGSFRQLLVLSHWLRWQQQGGIYSLAERLSIGRDGTLTGEQDYNDAGGITLPTSDFERKVCHSVYNWVER